MTARPAALFDPVPGNIGLRGAGKLLFRFDEVDGVLPSDLQGNLDDLAPDIGNTAAPLSASCWTGPGRAFVAASSRALIAADLPGRDTLMQRDITIQLIVALPTGVGHVAHQTIIARGTHDGTAGEAYSYGLELFDWDAAGTYGIRFFWEDVGGTIRTDAGVALVIPGNAQFFLVTATRRWDSSTAVVCRYYANELKLGETTSTHGDLAGGTTGHTTVGGRLNGGNWEEFLTATIDEMFVADFEMSFEEVREVYHRLAIHQPAGVAMFAGLTPVGSKWAADPGNRIGRLVKVAGQALGQSIAAAEELRALWLADAIPRETVGRLEKLLGLAPKPRDSLDTRRARCISYMSREEGYSIPAVQLALSEVLALDPADIEIVEFTNVITDNFATLEVERWLAGDVGTWALAGGGLQLTVPNGTDMRWEPTRAQSFIRTPMSLPSSGFYVSARFGTYALLPVNTMCGIHIHNRRSNNTLWFGVYRDGGGTLHVGWASFVGNVMSAFTALAAAGAAPLWIRLEQRDAAAATYRMSWSATGTTPTSGFTTHDITIAFTDPEWAGFGAVSTDAALATDLTIRVDDFLLRTPNAMNRPNTWYAYRDPGLAGAPDMVGGKLLVKKVKPAHTYAAAIQNKSVLCDDPRDGCCDVGPMGAI